MVTFLAITSGWAIRASPSVRYLQRAHPTLIIVDVLKRPHGRAERHLDFSSLHSLLMCSPPPTGHRACSHQAIEGLTSSWTFDPRWIAGMIFACRSPASRSLNVVSERNQTHRHFHQSNYLTPHSGPLAIGMAKAGLAKHGGIGQRSQPT